MAEFSDLASKLGAPSKKSQFERQKAEAEAKKAREKAETAAVLAEFEKSFDDEDNNRSTHGSTSRGPPAPGKRHFTSTNLKSGPGSLPRSGPGSLGPAFKKRPFDDYTDRRDRERFHHSDPHVRRDEQEQDDEKAAKPTLHLASMPPSSSPTFIKGLFAHTPLQVENVRMLPTSTASGTSGLRRSSSAIVTLAAETPATDIDTVVSHLQNKYMGYGFKLSISRHLSSAALSSSAMTVNAASALPFGARAVAQNASLSRAPPPNQRFAPPQSYNASYSREPATQVIVQPPSDLKQLKLIHKTLEALLTYGPEFEALLMSRSEVQREEKWSWLWDSSTVGGIYYRWRLWSILTNSSKRDQPGPRREVIFEGESAWHAPDHGLRFEYTTQLDAFVSDEDYNSSDEEDDDDARGGDLARRYNDHNTSGIIVTDEGTNNGMGYLDPLAKAKLTHLLSRLPEVNTKLRRGDVARITAFAIQHAGAGGNEVAALITRNIIRPFSATDKNGDNTSASMVGLYIISDILSCSASAGVRHAWRYRTLFEQALRQQKVFENLGRAEKDHRWGKLKGEKWKRSVQSLLSLWEGWSVFPQTAQEHFVSVFNDPPLTEEEKRLFAESDVAKKPDDDDAKSKTTNRWKTVEDEANADVSMDDVDGTPMVEEDEDMESGLENIDGISMADSSEDEAETIESGQESKPVQVEPGLPLSLAVPAQPARRQRPKAADLFS